MSYVKLDEQILISTIWIDHDATRVFLAALVRAVPFALEHATPTLRLDDQPDDFVLPPGPYGFAAGSGVGLACTMANLPEDRGMAALRRLMQPEIGGGSQEFAGRRLARISGGFVIINYAKFRDKDHTAKERMERYRKAKEAKRIALRAQESAKPAPVAGVITGDDSNAVALRVNGDERRSVTHSPMQSAEEYPSAALLPDRKPRQEAIKELRAIYPKRSGSNPWTRAERALHARLTEGATMDEVLAGARRYAEFIRATGKERTEYVMQAATFCGPDKHFLEPWTPPEGKTPEKRKWE